MGLTGTYPWFLKCPELNTCRANIGHPNGYTSYDYAAAISEERLVDREKYSEAKIQASFLVQTPQYLNATVLARSTDAHTSNRQVSIIPLVEGKTQLLVVRYVSLELPHPKPS